MSPPDIVCTQDRTSPRQMAAGLEAGPANHHRSGNGGRAACEAQGRCADHLGVGVDREVRRLVRRCIAEHDRTGSLSLDDVLRVLERRQTADDVRTSVLAELRQLSYLPSPRSDELPEGWKPPEEDRDWFEASAFDLYMKQLGDVGLLFREDEVRIGRRIRAGRGLLPVVFRANSLTDEEVGVRSKRLIAGAIAGLRVDPGLEPALLDGSRAEDHFFRANLRLVVSVAKKTHWIHPMFEPLDLIQAGNIGLSHAIRKFDHTKGFKFSTYATWWIKQSVSRFLADHGRMIRLPAYVHDKLRRVRAAQSALYRELGREPTGAEIADWASLDAGDVEFLLEAGQTVVRFERPVGSGADAELGEFVAVDDPAVAFVDREGAHAALIERLCELPQREREVVYWRFGLDGHEPETLERVGERFGVTRERIRQIEKKVLIKLSSCDELRELQGLQPRWAEIGTHDE